MVQAFDADSLESLWIYHDPLKGQPNCPITVSNGYAYTGFWNSETGDASFVCIPIADERPTASNEEKYAAWRHVQAGGFYWAGACVQNGVLLVGTDDGQNLTSPVLSTGRVLLFDAATGALLDEVGGIRGDVRSTICYDSGSNAYYATSKGGEFIQIKLDATGRKIASKQTLKLQNGTTRVAMSTSTPVVYNGRPMSASPAAANLMRIPAITSQSSTLTAQCPSPTAYPQRAIRRRPSAHNGV